MLASGSPRRRELLAALIPEFDVLPSDIPEPTTGHAIADAAILASGKAREIANSRPDAVVVGSDTIVFDDLRSYGKPESADEAVEMLSALAGRTHRVVTAVAVIAGDQEMNAANVSRVLLANLDAETIAAYVASGRPLDKAGAYAIQDEDLPTVAALDGCYCGVMGLPLWTLKRALEAVGVSCAAPSSTYERCTECPARFETTR